MLSLGSRQHNWRESLTAMEQVQLACTSSAQVQMYGRVAFLVFSNALMAFVGILAILEPIFVTCAYGASIVLKQTVNNSYDDDHMQDMTHIHNQIGIVF